MITITVSQDKPQPSLNIRRLKLWAADAGMIKDNYSVHMRLDKDGNPVGQFSLINLYMPEVGFDSANTQAATISHADMVHIAAIQKTDEKTIDQKMNWLLWGGVNEWGAPMRTGGYTHDWRDALSPIKIISAAYAGRAVEVLERRTFTNVRYNGLVEPSVPMSRIRTSTPDAIDWTLIIEVTAVSKNDVPIRPCGTVYLPLITKYPQAWVMDRWLYVG